MTRISSTDWIPELKESITSDAEASGVGPLCSVTNDPEPSWTRTLQPLWFSGRSLTAWSNEDDVEHAEWAALARRARTHWAKENPF